MIRSFLVVLIICIAAQSVIAADPLTWTNPIVKNRADPHIVLHTDGYYYMTASVPEYDRIELRRARTIGDLATAEPKVIWRRHVSGPMSGYIWAPEIHFINGKWYVYFSAGEAPSGWNIRLYVLESAAANPLEGEWVEKGQLKVNWESMTLDATTFEHRGVRYLVWAQFEPKKSPSDIYIARMDTPVSIVGKQVKLCTATYPWELRQFRVQEGPAILIRNGRVFLTYSTNSTDWKYCMGMLTADENANLLDPKSWKKSPEPVLDSLPEINLWGPGHNSFTTTPDGKTDLLVFHARDYKYDGPDPLHTGDRSTYVQVIRWKPDGTPDFSPPQR
jgi:GH43 family beta-xylosidase